MKPENDSKYHSIELVNDLFIRNFSEFSRKVHLGTIDFVIYFLMKPLDYYIFQQIMV